MKLLNKFKISLPPLPTAPPTHTPQRSTLLLLTVLVAIAVFSHFLLGHLVIVVYGVIIWALKAASIARVAAAPPRWMVMVFTILSFVLVLVLYGGWNGQRAGISFLVLLAALKFLESQSLRDYYLVCLILLFLASSSFLFNSSLMSIVVVLCYTIGTIAIMLRLSDPSPEHRGSALVTSSTILVKALPLAVLLFFFFPRIHGNFGFIPSQDDLRGDSQLNDSLVAGDFANSAFSNEPAFRVEFEGSTPPKNLLYWRAKVMIDERNFAWEVRRPDANTFRTVRDMPPRTAEEDHLIKYQIVHEPSEDDFLPYLDYAYNPEHGMQLPDASVFRFKKESGLFAYNGEASRFPNMPELQNQGRLANQTELLSTRSVPSARVQALMRGWRNNARRPSDLVDQALAYMRENAFEYSLTPPGLGDDPVDEFLFETRSGYCEHYASTFTILMRWLGIPARVVVGYQGGTQNVVGNYLQVRYSDAHAWSEVWVDNQWQRVDPTAVSSLGEQRITQGMAALLALWEDDLIDRNGASLTDYLNPSSYERAIRRLRDSWDNMGYQWNKWVINYDFNAQKTLLTNLGFEHRNSVYTLLGLLIASVMAMMLFYFWQLIPKAVKLGEAQQTYLRFVGRLNKFELLKEAAETPLEFAERATVKLPLYENQINEITENYIQLRYGKDPGSLEKFQALVKQFKPNNKATN